MDGRQNPSLTCAKSERFRDKHHTHYKALYKCPVYLLFTNIGCCWTDTISADEVGILIYEAGCEKLNAIMSHPTQTKKALTTVYPPPLLRFPFLGETGSRPVHLPFCSAFYRLNALPVTHPTRCCWRWQTSHPVPPPHELNETHVVSFIVAYWTHYVKHDVIHKT